MMHFCPPTFSAPCRQNGISWVLLARDGLSIFATRPRGRKVNHTSLSDDAVLRESQVDLEVRGGHRKGPPPSIYLLSDGGRGRSVHLSSSTNQFHGVWTFKASSSHSLLRMLENPFACRGESACLNQRGEFLWKPENVLLEWFKHKSGLIGGRFKC